MGGQQTGLLADAWRPPPLEAKTLIMQTQVHDSQGLAKGVRPLLP
jgi:hypothetical protein